MKRTWALEEHLCRSCGGRILRCVTGNGMTPGGNPVYMCADCLKCGYNLDDICWCGFSTRGNRTTKYLCRAFSFIDKYPKLKEVFRSCGCEPFKGGIGLVTRDSFYKVIEESKDG